MRTHTLWTMGAMLIGIVSGAAQAPSPPPIFVNSIPSGLARSPAAVIDRLLSFDVNADKRVSADELPERMQELVARGDKNADAALDSDEIRALVTAASFDRTRLSSRPQLSEGLPGVVRDLKLPPSKHERALAIVVDRKPPVDVNDPSSSALFGEMKALLDDEEYENFVAAATRLSRTDIRFRTVGRVVSGVLKRVQSP